MRWSRPQRVALDHQRKHVGVQKANEQPCGPNVKPFRLNTKSGGPNMGPNASLWNTVCVGYARVGFALAM